MDPPPPQHRHPPLGDKWQEHLEGTHKQSERCDSSLVAFVTAEMAGSGCGHWRKWAGDGPSDTIYTLDKMRKEYKIKYVCVHAHVKDINYSQYIPVFYI